MEFGLKESGSPCDWKLLGRRSGGRHRVRRRRRKSRGDVSPQSIAVLKIGGQGSCCRRPGTCNSLRSCRPCLDCSTVERIQDEWGALNVLVNNARKWIKQILLVSFLRRLLWKSGRRCFAAVWKG